MTTVVYQVFLPLTKNLVAVEHSTCITIKLLWPQLHCVLATATTLLMRVKLNDGYTITILKLYTFPSCHVFVGMQV